MKIAQFSWPSSQIDGMKNKGTAVTYVAFGFGSRFYVAFACQDAIPHALHCKSEKDSDFIAMFVIIHLLWSPIP